jgi:hypothetical protein
MWIQVVWYDPVAKRCKQVKWGFLHHVTFATQINYHSSNDNMHLSHIGDDSRWISLPVRFHTMAMTKCRITSAPFFISLVTNKKPRCSRVLFILRNEENAVFVFCLFTTLSLVMTHVCAPVISTNKKLMLYLQIECGLKKLNVSLVGHYLLRAPSCSDKLWHVGTERILLPQDWSQYRVGHKSLTTLCKS